MCQSMVNIQSPTAEIRRGKKRRRRNSMKIYMVSLLHRATIKEPLNGLVVCFHNSTEILCKLARSIARLCHVYCIGYLQSVNVVETLVYVGNGPGLIVGKPLAPPVVSGWRKAVKLGTSFLWPPYIIGGHYIFVPWFLLSVFFLSLWPPYVIGGHYIFAL